MELAMTPTTLYGKTGGVPRILLGFLVATVAATGHGV
jgi:hypothetical protein